MKQNNSDLNFSELSDLLAYNPKLRTEELFDLYVSKKPTSTDYSWLMRYLTNEETSLLNSLLKQYKIKMINYISGRSYK